MQYLIDFPLQHGCKNAPQCYFVRTLHVFYKAKHSVCLNKHRAINLSGIVAV